MSGLVLVQVELNNILQTTARSAHVIDAEYLDVSLIGLFRDPHRMSQDTAPPKPS